MAGSIGVRERRLRSFTAASAGMVALSVIAVAPAGAVADPGMSVSGAQVLPVSVAHAGGFVGWGGSPNAEDAAVVATQVTTPASLTGVPLREIAMSTFVSVALTADGRVVAWGSNPSRNQTIPSRVASMDVVDIDSAPAYSGAVSRSGEVVVWGQATPRTDPIDVPADLTGVTQLALGQENAFALKSDGTVTGWGKNWFGLNTPPAPPAGHRFVAIAASGNAAYALTDEGNVVRWGDEDGAYGTLPPEVTTGGNVVTVSAMLQGGMALLKDGSVVGWGNEGGSLPDLNGKKAVAIDGDQYISVVLDEDGVFHVGGSNATLMPPPPAVQGRAVAQFSASNNAIGVIVTELLSVALPQVSGTAKVGSVLTGTPGTFSGAPDSVTGQWLANGTSIPGATGATLTLTEAQAGKSITYASTATKAGQTAVTSTSAATSAVTGSTTPPPSTKVASKTAVTKVTVAKKAEKVTVAGKVAASKSPTGTAKVVITLGKKTIVAKSVKVAASGAIQLVVKKFGKLAIKKTTVKGKKGTYRGKYKVTVSYLGNALVKPSAGGKAFVIKK